MITINNKEYRTLQEQVEKNANDIVELQEAGATSDFDELTNRPKYNNTVMTHTTNIPEVKTATWDGKQDAIADLSTIRSGATAGATALQPDDNVSELVNDAGYLTEHQSLAAYRTSAAQDVIDAGKQATITSSAPLDSLLVRVQDVFGEDPVTLKNALGTLKNGKQDNLTAGTGIDITNNVISATGESGMGMIEIDASSNRSGTLTAAQLALVNANKVFFRVRFNIYGDVNLWMYCTNKSDNSSAQFPLVYYSGLSQGIAGSNLGVTKVGVIQININTGAWTVDIGNNLFYMPQSADLNAKQNVLTAGSGISIVNNVISATGGGSASWVEKGTYTLATTGQDFLTYQLDDDNPSSLTLAGKMCYIEVYSNDSGIAWSSTPFILDQTRCGTFICDGAEAEYFNGMNGLSISFLSAAGQEPEKVEIKFTQSYGAEETGTDYVTIYCYE